MEISEDFKDVILDDYPVIFDSDQLTKAIIKFESLPHNCLIVQDKKGILEGLLTIKELFNISNLKTTVKKEMMKFPFLKSFEINNLVELSIEKNIDILPLVDNNNKTLFVVSVKKLALKLLENLNIDMDTIIEPFPNQIYLSDSVDHVFPLIRSYDFDLLPIFNVEKANEVVGVLPIRNLTKYLYKTESDTIGDFKGERKKFSSNIDAFVLSSYLKCVLDEKSLKSAKDLVNLMLSNKYNTLIITNNKKELLGLISLKTILKEYVNNYVKQTSKYTIRVLGAPDRDIEGIASRKVSTLLDRYHEFFGLKTEPEGNVRFKKIEHQSKAGMFSYEAEIRVSFGKGKDENYSVSSTDWGAEKSLNKTFNKISRLLSDRRKITRGYSRETPRTNI